MLARAERFRKNQMEDICRGPAESFYTENFGFDVAFSGEWYIHLISQSGVQVGFLLPDQPTQPQIFQKAYGGEGVIFSLEVDEELRLVLNL